MFIAGNWKMFKGPREAGEFLPARLREVDLGGVDAAVCPPFVSLGEAVQALAGHGGRPVVRAELSLGGRRRLHRRGSRPPMLRELGVYGTIVGHSERRQ